MTKILSGIYVVEYKWELIWLKNKLINTEEAIQPYKFKTLLLQSFDADYIKKIFEALTCEKKLIIDFDKDIVKVINQKDKPFLHALSPYFSKSAVQEWYDNGYEEDIYNKGDF